MNETEANFDIAIIGGGVVGCAIARELSGGSLTVALFESSSDLGNGTSKANTAIWHTGFDTVPGSLESSLVHRGYEKLGIFAEQTGIALERTGAVLVAWDEEQAAALKNLQEKALANGVVDTEIISAEEVIRREPHLGEGVQGGLVVPGEGIIDPWSVTLAFANLAVLRGVKLFRSTPILGITEAQDRHLLETHQGSYGARWLINVAGLYSDVIDRMIGHEGFTITPRRGQLLVFDKLARPLLSGIVLPVPTERTKGVLVSPTVWGNLLLGPTAEDLDDKGDTRSTSDGVKALLADGKRILPRLMDYDVTAVYAGLRAATEHRDYQITSYPNERYVCGGGIRSTGLTGSLGIAEYVAELLRSAGVEIPSGKGLESGFTMPPLGECQIRPLQDPNKISEDPAYGTVLCHCEQVSLGEVRDACHAMIAAENLEGVRRRTRALNGRCQGFYCGAEVVDVVARELGTAPESLMGFQ